jgi:hypothetical protein
MNIHIRMSARVNACVYVRISVCVCVCVCVLQTHYQRLGDIGGQN